MDMSNTVFCLKWDASGELSLEDRVQVLTVLGQPPGLQQNTHITQEKKTLTRRIPPQELKAS